MYKHQVCFVSETLNPLPTKFQQSISIQSKVCNDQMEFIIINETAVTFDEEEQSSMIINYSKEFQTNTHSILQKLGQYPQVRLNHIFGSGTAESPISHLVRTPAPAPAPPCVQQILNHVIG